MFIPAPVPAIVLSLAAAASPLIAQLLPTDERLIRGELENGLRYIIRPHNVPAGRVELQIHFETGSVNETDRQRGLAHYLEHMAFNGSKNFKPGSLIPLFESMRLQFGRDQNAYTNMTETVYQLSMPENKPELLEKGLLFFSDVTGRLDLSQEEVDAERQIIQEERRRSLSGSQRTQYYVMDRIAPGSLYGKRITIGTEETINSVQPQDFRDYWEKHYTASNATLMVVGDVKPDDVIPLIEKCFGDLPKKPKPTRQDIGLRPASKPYAIVTSDAELTSASVRITRVSKPRPAPKTIPEFRANLIESLSQSCFNGRMQEKIARGGTSYTSLMAMMNDSPYTIRQAGVMASSEPSKWRTALGDAALELQRARKFGFTQRELDNVKKRIISSAEQAVNRESTMPSSSIIGAINRDIGAEEVTMSASQELTLLREMLPSITLDEVSSYFAKEMDLQNAAFVAVLPSSADVPTEPELLELGLAALKVEPTAEAEATYADKLMDELPKGGKVAQSSMHDASGTWSAWLDNGVRVHHKFMDDRKDSVTVSISLIGGELLETAQNRGITGAAALPFGRLATSKLSSSDIRELMTGKKVNVGGAGGGGGRRGRGGGAASVTDGLRLFIFGSPSDLETGMQVAYLMLTDPKIEDAAFSQWKIAQIQNIEASNKNPQRFAQRSIARTVFPESEIRLQPETVEQINSIDQAAAQAWLNQLIKTSPIEVTIVGDLPREEAIALASRYFGSLPARERVSDKTYSSLRTIERPKGPRKTEVTIKSDTPQAFVMAGFYGTDSTNVADARALNMASRILSMRMTKVLREKEGLVYSMGTSSSPANTYPGFGLVSASATTDPHKVNTLVTKIHELYTEFANDGPTEEELNIAKGQMANTYETALKEPSWWATRLDQLDFKGAKLDNIVNEPDAMQALTAEQVKDAFAKYYSPETSITVTVQPEGGSADAKEPEKDATPVRSESKS